MTNGKIPTEHSKPRGGTPRGRCPRGMPLRGEVGIDHTSRDWTKVLALHLKTPFREAATRNDSHP